MTLTVALSYSSVPVSHDSVTVSWHAQYQLNGIQPSFILLFRHVLLMWHVFCGKGLLLIILRYFDFIIDIVIFCLWVQPKTTKTKHSAVFMWQPAWPLLGFSNKGALAGRGWDYWCPSLQAPWGTFEVMMRTETNTHIELCTQIHTQTHKNNHADLHCLLLSIIVFSTQCREWKYLVTWLLHLVAVCCHYILRGHCSASTVSNMISGFSDIP